MASDKVTKEGGWGYVVAFSSFIIHVIVCGVTYSTGVFHLALLDTFKENQLWTSLITTPILGLTAVSGIFFLSCVHSNSSRECSLHLKGLQAEESKPDLGYL